MISDDPKANSWENPELVPDIYYPGKLTLTRDGTPVDTFFNAPVRVEDMAGEDLANYEPYTLIDNAGGEDGGCHLYADPSSPGEGRRCDANV